jgi:hypothetical protein
MGWAASLRSRPPAHVKAREEVLVVEFADSVLLQCPTPDFSMPYNVITMTCTVLALFFGRSFFPSAHTCPRPFLHATRPCPLPCARKTSEAPEAN